MIIKALKTNLILFSLIDTPSTVWDPAPGDEVTTLESQHIIEGEGITKKLEDEDDAASPTEESPKADDGGVGELFA